MNDVVKPQVVEREIPTFHQFATEWRATKRQEVCTGTVGSYDGYLTLHLLPSFHGMRLDEITAHEVDRHRAHKLAEGAIGKVTINKTVRCSARSSSRRWTTSWSRATRREAAIGGSAPTSSAGPTWTTPSTIAAVLDAGSRLDAAAPYGRRHVAGRAFIAVLVFAGPRIEAACCLRWRDVDLANGRLSVGEAKADAGVRDVDLVPALRDEFATWKARSRRIGANNYFFATSTGGKPSKDNLRDRVFNAAVRDAQEALDHSGWQPLPDGLTPHGMRHTFCSLLFAIGNDRRYVMGQLGHTDPGFTRRVYAPEMRRTDQWLAALQSLVQGASLRTPLAAIVGSRI